MSRPHTTTLSEEGELVLGGAGGREGGKETTGEGGEQEGKDAPASRIAIPSGG